MILINAVSGLLLTAGFLPVGDGLCFGFLIGTPHGLLLLFTLLLNSLHLLRASG
jgi:hypothetical protein